MHLLPVKSQIIQDGDAIDLEQNPADIIILSAADSEITALAKAYQKYKKPKITLRLANIMRLTHNFSVDLYIEKTAQYAKIIIVRLLGGEAYWSYGCEQMHIIAQKNKIKLVLIPGDPKPDPNLYKKSHIEKQNYNQIHAYFTQGGSHNMERLIAYCSAIIGKEKEPLPPKIIPQCGYYTPNHIKPGQNKTKKPEIVQIWKKNAPITPIIFYRALLEGDNCEPIDALCKKLQQYNLNPLPLYITGLKNPISTSFIKEALKEYPPNIILNTTGFAATKHQSGIEPQEESNPFHEIQVPILQLILAGSSKNAWKKNAQGLTPKDLAMNIVMPELDGRIITNAISFKKEQDYSEKTQSRIITYQPNPESILFTTKLTKAWCRLQKIPSHKKHVAIILANYPNKNGRIGNGVGYDTPASTLNILKTLKKNGYHIDFIPKNPNQIMQKLLKGQTNKKISKNNPENPIFSLKKYEKYFSKIPKKIQNRVMKQWGQPHQDPFFYKNAFTLPIISLGNVIIAIQPARGYNIDPKKTYHDPLLPPPHGYFAFYFYLRHEFKANAVIHNGKHGNLEWLPGKATALGKACFPQAILDTIPNIYPFIVNDPGEGTQAKRRNHAVIIDHLTPPLTKAETYGPLHELENLMDEYAQATALDTKRANILTQRILEHAQFHKMDKDANIDREEKPEIALQKLDAYICDLKEMQIRDGLHILGQNPKGKQETDMLLALSRIPRNLEQKGDQSILRAIARDVGYDPSQFDPLDHMGEKKWNGKKPKILKDAIEKELWRTYADTNQRIEKIAAQLIEKEKTLPQNWKNTQNVINEIKTRIRPKLRLSGKNEICHLIHALEGKFVPAGPSGAPTRGRIDVLPTGRNFFSIDNRSLPTPAAWRIGRDSAERLLIRHFQDFGKYPKSVGLSVWGTANMRTGGDDIAQALALIGAKPKWDHAHARIIGFEIIPLPQLGRPRVDVTMRISGFFRDAFPTQITLLDQAIRAIGKLYDEPRKDNPIAENINAETQNLKKRGMNTNLAEKRAGARIFGSPEGAYGAGLQTLIDENIWDEKADLAENYITWGAYPYGTYQPNIPHRQEFRTKLKKMEAVIHNQDNREHDILDSDDYYQFEGGMSVAVEHSSGKNPVIWHNDHSNPEKPVIRTLDEEIARVMRARVVNPKWIKGIMRHGYKGAFEIAASIDYLFAFAATTHAVKNHHFDMAWNTFIEDKNIRRFIKENNPDALCEIGQKFLQAIERKLWTPKSNSAYHLAKQIAKTKREKEENYE